jgi:hypothetical protein
MNDPMEEGKLAAANVEPKTANPYPPDTEAHEEWNEGWSHYHDVDEDGEPRDDA